MRIYHSLVITRPHSRDYIERTMQRRRDEIAQENELRRRAREADRLTRAAWADHMEWCDESN